MRRSRKKSEPRGSSRRADTRATVAGTSVTTAERSPARPALLAILILSVAVVVSVIHWPALSAEALSFDDTQYLTDNPLVQDPSWTNAGRFLTEVLEPSTVAGYYQPLAMISLMADHAWGASVSNLTPFHVTSLALYVANTSLVVLVLYQLFGNAWAAALVGLLFGAHPMCVEAIPWVGERKTLLAAFFGLACLSLYIRFVHKNGWGSYAGSLIAYLLALLSKPTSVPLFAMLFLLDLWPFNRLGKRSMIEKVPFFILAAASALITYVSQDRTAFLRDPSQVGTSPLRIPLTICHNIVFYPLKMLWPVNLSSHYPFPEPMTISQPMVAVGVVGTLLLIAGLGISLRWTRAWAVGWLCFFVVISPTLGVVGFTNVIAADKYAYLPAIGLLLPVAHALTGIMKRAKFTVLVVVAVLLGLEAGVTRRQLSYWSDTITLHQRMIALAPDAVILRGNISYFLIEAGSYDAAIEHLDHALRIRPDDSNANHNMGVALSSLGRNEAALGYLRKSLPTARHPGSVHYSLGLALNRLGRPAEAIPHFDQAVQLDRIRPDAHYAKGIALDRLGETAKAVAEYSLAVELQPGMGKAHHLLGVALTKQRKLEPAVLHLTEAIERNPDDPIILTDLAVALKKQRRTDEAATYLDQALRLDSTMANALNHRGDILADRGQHEEAIEFFRRSVAAAPDRAMGHLMLSVSLEELGDLDQAVSALREAIRCEPQNVKALLRLGSALRKQGRVEDAIEKFREVIRVDPDHALAHHNLAFDLSKLGRTDEAALHMEQAVRSNPSDPDLHHSLGVLLERQGNFEEAASAYRAALDLDPMRSDTRDRLEKVTSKPGGGSP